MSKTWGKKRNRKFFVKSDHLTCLMVPPKLDILIGSKNYSQPAAKTVQYAAVVYKVNIPIIILLLTSILDKSP